MIIKKEYEPQTYALYKKKSKVFQEVDLTHLFHDIDRKKKILRLFGVRTLRIRKQNVSLDSYRILGQRITNTLNQIRTELAQYFWKYRNNYQSDIQQGLLDKVCLGDQQQMELSRMIHMIDFTHNTQTRSDLRWPFD